MLGKRQPLRQQNKHCTIYMLNECLLSHMNTGKQVHEDQVMAIQ
jgi:hypothetical protein